MKMVARAAKLYSRLTSWLLALLCVSTIQLAAQTPAVFTPATGSANNAALARVHGTIELDGPWRFQVGDDPDGRLGWADPGFDGQP